MLLLLVCLSLLALSHGFATVRPVTSISSNNNNNKARSSQRLFMSEPSDTSSDSEEDLDYVTVESEPYEPTAEEALVSNVLDLMPTGTLGEASPETRNAISEALYKLEAVNPTSNPTMSPLLNGVWELRYAGGYSPEWALASPTRQLALFLYSGGYSPGLFALGLAQKLPLVDVGALEITISRDQPRVEATVKVKAGMMESAESAVSVKARLQTESDIRLRETYESASVMDQNINLPTLLQYQRDIFVTYLDEDLLIVRDASGVPEILIRKEKVFSRNWGTEPTDADDQSYPGEGQEFGSRL